MTLPVKCLNVKGSMLSVQFSEVHDIVLEFRGKSLDLRRASRWFCRFWFVELLLFLSFIRLSLSVPNSKVLAFVRRSVTKASIGRPFCVH